MQCFVSSLLQKLQTSMELCSVNSLFCHFFAVSPCSCRVPSLLGLRPAFLRVLAGGCARRSGADVTGVRANKLLSVADFNTQYGVTAAQLPPQRSGEGIRRLRRRGSCLRRSARPQSSDALASSKHVFGKSPPLTRCT